MAHRPSLLLLLLALLLHLLLFISVLFLPFLFCTGAYRVPHLLSPSLPQAFSAFHSNLIHFSCLQKLVCQQKKVERIKVIKHTGSQNPIMTLSLRWALCNHYLLECKHSDSIIKTMWPCFSLASSDVHSGAAKAVRKMHQNVCTMLLWLLLWQSVRQKEREKMERASILCQPLSCFRGLLGIFYLPRCQTYSWYWPWTRTGEGRDHELSLRSCRHGTAKGQAAARGLIIHSLGTCGTKTESILYTVLSRLLFA